MSTAQPVPDEAMGSEHSQNANSARSREDAELAKWKAAELVKVWIAQSPVLS